MSLPFDLVYTIGHFCDPATRFNFCLASKEFYLSDTNWVLENKFKQYTLGVQRYMNLFLTKRSKLARLRVAHALFRYLVFHKNMLKHERLEKFRPAVKAKLTELGQTGMCKRKVRKYMRELEL